MWLEAGLWGLLGGSALVLGALIAFWAPLPQRAIAAVMAIGSGVLISAVAFDLMDDAFKLGGFAATAGGFLAGGALYTAANVYISARGARHRKRSGDTVDPETQPAAGSAKQGTDTGLAIAVGALLDGIPESVVIGVSLVADKGVSLVMVAAVFLSNVPEGLSSAAGMKKAGRSARYIFGVWGAIALASGVSAALGNLLLGGASPSTIAAVTALAAGAILAMLVDTMIPEATESTHDYSGLIAVVGFLIAFVLTKWEG